MHQPPTAKPTYSLLRDPVYYIAVAFFAVLTTALPALLGAAWFLPLAQTVALWLLLLVALRRDAARTAVIVLALWVVLQAITLFALTLLAPTPVETAVGDGFRYGAALLAWFYAGNPLPASWATQPLLHLLEVAGVLLGAAASGGLLGVWFLMRSVNLFAFGAAALMQSARGVAGLLGALQPWLLLRLAGYVILLPLVALPGYTGVWLPARWPPRRRRWFVIGLALVGAGLLLESFLPALWHSAFGAMP